MKSAILFSLLLTSVVTVGVVASQKQFYCKHCGLQFASILGLTAGICQRHPDGTNRRHELYEGNEKDAYVCKYCGRVEKSIRVLTASQCIRHPKGELKGHHEPSM